jgi:hypothetical protein
VQDGLLEQRAHERIAGANGVRDGHPHRRDSDHAPAAREQCARSTHGDADQADPCRGQSVDHRLASETWMEPGRVLIAELDDVTQRREPVETSPGGSGRPEQRGPYVRVQADQGLCAIPLQ